jgi:hypothetical protein
MNVTIVTSHWKEDLTWLKKSKFPVVLIDKEGADPTCFEPQYVIPNKGTETSSYFTYIIKNYDCLPDHVAFIHGHENAWHHRHKRPLLEVIESANIQKYGYIPLNNMIRVYSFIDEPPNGPAHGFKFKTKWKNLKITEVPPNDNSTFFIPICAQFIVSRDNIRRVPKERWEEFLNVLVTEEGNKEYGYFFEYIFHVLFGEDTQFELKTDWFSFPYEIDYWNTIPEFTGGVQQITRQQLLNYFPQLI